MIGAVFTLIFLGQIDGLAIILIPFATGSFIYIATADLIPELHKEVRVHESIRHLVALLLGIISMALLLLLE